MQERVFLTIVTWPEGCDRDLVAELLTTPTGLDFATLRLLVGPTAPRILSVAPEAAAAGVAALLEHGGDGFACTIQDLGALGPTLKVKDLRLEVDGLGITLWRGPETSVDPFTIDVVVRARLSETTGLGPAPADVQAAGRLAAAALLDPHWGVGGAYGWAARVHSAAEFADLSAIDRRVVTSHKLDFHVPGQGVFQIDGDKFGYQILGELRGHSDNVNIDRMCELLTHFNRDIVVDPYFSMWNPPTGYQRLRLPQMKVNDDDPAFAFYSRWAALMYRHVLGSLES